MTNPLQRYPIAQDGSFILKVTGKRPFLSMNEFTFNFQIGDLAVVYAKDQGEFNTSYVFVKPITRPAEAAYDLMSADRFVKGFILPMLKSFDHAINTGDIIDHDHMQVFVNDYALSNVKLSYKSDDTYVLMSGNF